MSNPTPRTRGKRFYSTISDPDNHLDLGEAVRVDSNDSLAEHDAGRRRPQSGRGGSMQLHVPTMNDRNSERKSGKRPRGGLSSFPLGDHDPAVADAVPSELQSNPMLAKRI